MDGVALVRLQDVDVQVGGRAVLTGVTFTLRAGEHWLLQGPNGGGKSSLLRLLRGELWPSAGERTYLLDGQMRRSAVRARQAIALVSPDVEAYYLTRDWAQSVSDVLLAAHEGDALRLWTPTPEALARQAEVAALVGLTDLLGRDFRTLSHGQRRRAVLGRALMPRPLALLLDEFTDGLSVAALAELRAVLEAVAAQGVSLVLATHTPDEAPALPWQPLWVGGGLVREGHPAVPEAARAASWTSPAPRAGAVLVSVEDASVYRNGHLALADVRWSWREGEQWLVRGPNGAGKTTFARLVSGLLHPAVGGQVRRPVVQGTDTLEARARTFGIVGAELSIAQRRDWNGFEVIASGFSGSVGFAPNVQGQQAARVRALAARLGALELLHRPASALSQGQLKRLLLARALVHRPRLIVFDEPFDFLDAATRAQLSALLGEAVADGAQVLLVAHRAGDVPPFITHELQLDAGSVLSAGPVRTEQDALRQAELPL